MICVTCKIKKRYSLNHIIFPYFINFDLVYFLLILLIIILVIDISKTDDKQPETISVLLTAKALTITCT